MIPRISVVIPVRNGSPFVSEAVQSVLDQEGARPHEIIVVDDGSTDQTPVLLDAFGDRIRRRRIASSGGPAGPRNTGIQMSKGDWIAFLDADDRWFRHKLRRQIEVIGKYPGVGFICSNFYNYDPTEGRVVGHFKVLRDTPGARVDAPFAGHPMRCLLKHNFVGTSTVLVRKNVVERVGLFNTAYVNSQDFDYWARCSFHTTFFLISDILMDKRRHARNWSGDPFVTPLAKKRILADLLVSHREAIWRAGLVRDLKEASAMNCYRLGALSFEKGEEARAFAYFWEALWLFPAPGNFIVFCRGCLGKILRKMGLKWTRR